MSIRYAESESSYKVYSRIIYYFENHSFLNAVWLTWLISAFCLNRAGSIITNMNLEFRDNGNVPNDTTLIETVLRANTSFNITSASGKYNTPHYTSTNRAARSKTEKN